jgi:hypothetical protein
VVQQIKVCLLCIRWVLHNLPVPCELYQCKRIARPVWNLHKSRDNREIHVRDCKVQLGGDASALWMDGSISCTCKLDLKVLIFEWCGFRQATTLVMENLLGKMLCSDAL